MTFITLTASLATLCLGSIDSSDLWQPQSLLRQLAALCFGLYGLLTLVHLCEGRNGCIEVLALAAGLASYLLARLSLVLRLSELVRGPLFARVMPQTLMAVLAALSFAVQTAAIGRLVDSKDHVIQASFVIDLLLLGTYAVWLLFCMARSILEKPPLTMSPKERLLLPKHDRNETTPLPCDFAQHCCLLAATLLWIGSAALGVLQASHGRDFSNLIANAGCHPLWLAATALTCLGFFYLAAADRMHDGSSPDEAKVWRKSRSPVWPSESARKPMPLDIQPFEHPYSNSTVSSPTVSEQLLKSIEDDFAETRSPTILVYSPEEVESQLIELGSPPSPDGISPAFSSAATLGHHRQAAVFSPSTRDSFPVTPDMREVDDFSALVSALPAPASHRSPPSISPPASPLPSIPEEEDILYSEVPIRPAPVETRRSSLVYFHGPTQSPSLTALGLLV